jgi:uncharacterized protein (UPF0248 family)
MFPRDVLNRIRWTGNPDLSGVRVVILHRGAPDDRKVICGEEISDLEQSYIVLKVQESETRIPYHRVQKISSDGGVVYDRNDYRNSNQD